MAIHAQRDFVSASYLSIVQAQEIYIPISASGSIGGDSLPDQTGNSGKLLVTDGTEASWSSSVTSPTASGSVGVRNITISTASATGGSDGDVWLTYI